MTRIEQHTPRLHAGAQVVYNQATLLTPVMVARPCEDVRLVAFPTRAAARLTTGLVLSPNMSGDEAVVLGFRKAAGDLSPPALAVLNRKQVSLICGAETQWRLHVVVLSEGTNEKYKGLDYLIVQTAALCSQLFSETFDKSFEDSFRQAVSGSDPWGSPVAVESAGGAETSLVTPNPEQAEDGARRGGRS